MTYAEAHLRRLEELAEIAAAKRRVECPGIQLEPHVQELPPAPYRDDETARRARALLDFHRGIRPEQEPHL